MKMKLLVILSILTCFNAVSAEVATTSVPTNWLLQNYMGDNIAVWNSGSACSNGIMTFGETATKDDKNRFWSLIMMAKVASKQVTVWYDNSAAPTTCIITSFTMNPE